MSNLIEKVCIKCGILKKISEFREVLNNIDGYAGKCKPCFKQYNKEYCEKNKEKLKKTRKVYNTENKKRFEDRNKKYREENKNKLNECNKIYREKNKEKIREQKIEYNSINKEKKQKRQKEYYLKNKEQLKRSSKEYYKNNKTEMRQYKRNYRQNNKDKINKNARDYRNNNVNAKIAALTRTRIRETLKTNNARKSNSSVKLLGCSYEFFKQYLESKFTKGMGWENHGLYGWHIDHIKPCSLFNLLDPEQQKLCFHYTNIQPLWATKEIAISYGESENYIGNLEKGRIRLN